MEKIVKFYALDEIEQAVADAEAGRVVRPICGHRRRAISRANAQRKGGIVMRILNRLKPALLLLPSFVLGMAAPASAIEITPEIVAKVGACVACHGADGIGKAPQYPNLAGQKATYIEKPLSAFRSGERKDPNMSAMAKPRPIRTSWISRLISKAWNRRKEDEYDRVFIVPPPGAPTIGEHDRPRRRDGAARAASARGKDPRLSIPGVAGKVIRRQDVDYELWREAMVWHMSKPKRYPDMIVQAKSAEDVIGAVNYARENKLKVAIRAGGHNSNGASLRDGGMLIDLSAMDDIVIDEAKQVASIQPGVRGLPFIQATRAKGLEFNVPHCPSVGLSGFTMGGGMGWNWPQRGGMAVHSIVGAEIVTADGKLLRATPDENPDLYWAVRGVGPGFFGVVTRLDLKLYPAPKSILASTYIFPLSEVEKVTSNLDAIRRANRVCDNVEPIAVLMHHPEVPADAPPEKSKIVFFTAFAFEDTEENARASLKPFEQLPEGSKLAIKMEYQPFDFEGLYARYSV